MRQFSIELKELDGKLLEMGGLVVSAIRRSVESLVDHNSDLARQVMRNITAIRRMEGEIDGTATRMLALRQPVARDLRLLTAAMKISNDLDRMGELAGHVAERSLSLIDWHMAAYVERISTMASLVEVMLLKCLDAFVRSDAELAASVVPCDAQVDALRDGLYDDLVSLIEREPTLAPPAIELVFVARNLERIGDHASNIARDVVFLVKGIDLRHETLQ